MEFSRIPLCRAAAGETHRGVTLTQQARQQQRVAQWGAKDTAHTEEDPPSPTGAAIATPQTRGSETTLQLMPTAHHGRLGVLGPDKPGLGRAC